MTKSRSVAKEKLEQLDNRIRDLEARVNDYSWPRATSCEDAGFQGCTDAKPDAKTKRVSL